MAKSIKTRRFIKQFLRGRISDSKASWMSICLKPLHWEVSVYGAGVDVGDAFRDLQDCLKDRGVTLDVRWPSLESVN